MVVKSDPFNVIITVFISNIILVLSTNGTLRSDSSNVNHFQSLKIKKTIGSYQKIILMMQNNKNMTKQNVNFDY